MGYVEEDDQEGEEGAEQTHNHQQTELGNVWQRAEADAGRARAQQAREARHTGYLWEEYDYLGHEQCHTGNLEEDFGYFEDMNNATVVI